MNTTINPEKYSAIREAIFDVVQRDGTYSADEVACCLQHLTIVMMRTSGMSREQCLTALQSYAHVCQDANFPEDRITRVAS